MLPLCGMASARPPDVESSFLVKGDRGAIRDVNLEIVRFRSQVGQYVLGAIKEQRGVSLPAILFAYIDCHNCA